MSQKELARLQDLKKLWTEFKSNPENKKVRIRNAAEKLNVSEAELLSTQLGDGDTSFLSVENIKDFFQQLFSLDQVMFLIRNENVVHEKIVGLEELTFSDNQIFEIKYNAPLLTFDEKSLAYLFFEKKIHAGKTLRSFQFFNQKGLSIIKIYLKGKSVDKFDLICEKYQIDYNYELQKDIPSTNKECDFISDVDMFFLRNDKPSNVNRITVDKSLLRDVLDKASHAKIPIQVHALGLNTIQYHRGVVKNLVDYGPWINIIDKNFNIHVLEHAISKTAVAEYLINNKKYYSIEFFDRAGFHLMGVCQLKEYELEFNNMIDDMGVLNEAIS